MVTRENTYTILFLKLFLTSIEERRTDQYISLSLFFFFLITYRTGIGTTIVPYRKFLSDVITLDYLHEIRILYCTRIKIIIRWFGTVLRIGTSHQFERYLLQYIEAFIRAICTVSVQCHSHYLITFRAYVD